MDEDFLPTPAEGEEEPEFIDRCMAEMLGRRLRVGTARQLCSIAWRRNVQPPADARLVAPPPLRDDIPDRFGDLFDEATRLGRSATEAAFLAGVAFLNGAWSIERIERELRTRGSLDAFLDDSQESTDAFMEFRQLYRDAYEGPRDEDGRRTGRETAAMVLTYISASDSASVLAPVRQGWWSYERWLREAISWIDSSGAQRVTAVGSSTKEGIRGLVREAFETGRDRDWISRTLKAMDGNGTLRLGLDAPRNKTLLNFIDGLDPDIPLDRRQKLIDRRYDQLLRSRARTISQTEVVEAANSAQIRTFSAAAQEGELDTNLYIIEWIARAIRCPRCAAMDGATREILSGQFVSDGSGPLGVEVADQPELHPYGWCFTRIIAREDARRPPAVANAVRFHRDPLLILLAA